MTTSRSDLYLHFPEAKPRRVLVYDRTGAPLSPATARGFVIGELKGTDRVLAQLPHVSGDPLGFAIRPLTVIELMGQAGGVDVHALAMNALWARGW